MKNKIFILTIIALITLIFFACTKDNLVEDNILTTPIINIGQTSGDTLGIAITASKSEAANQTTAVSFTKDTILVSYTVIAYGGGEATIELRNSNKQSKIYNLNSNQAVGQEPLGFKPSQVLINIEVGYTGVVAMTVIGK
ncbi:hypothetical protein MNBD_IGNAVI01-1644 [hydrothermal vent metagenome]|uniref:Lipoprotein n=1 Tax=hydrothermal vent metagenome TaxID=652676 RepID=A0A3B1CVR9_9ZZZZ